MVSIVIPTYNEEHTIARTLEHLRSQRGNFEVIVVDGESTDRTRARVEAAASGFPRPLRLLTAERNRARQLNRGAQAARGDAFLFLHADALLAPEAVESLEATLQKGFLVGGNFHLVFQGDSRWNKLFTWVNCLRRRLGIYYGDSGLFVRGALFESLGGFKPIPIMEDYEFVRRLERSGRTVCLPAVVLVSDRRWKIQGVFRTLISWLLVQALYSLGVSPQFLVRWYRPVRVEPRTWPEQMGQEFQPGGIIAGSKL
jgi:rSAM/selenodomain-associated transferase 2